MTYRPSAMLRWFPWVCVVFVALFATTGCSDDETTTPTGPAISLNTELRVQPDQAFNVTTSVTNIRWKLLAANDQDDGSLRVFGSLGFHAPDSFDDATLLFFDIDEILVAAVDIRLSLGDHLIQGGEYEKIFEIVVGDMRTANSITRIHFGVWGFYGLMCSGYKRHSRELVKRRLRFFAGVEGRACALIAVR